MNIREQALDAALQLHGANATFGIAKVENVIEDAEKIAEFLKGKKEEPNK